MTPHRDQGSDHTRYQVIPRTLIFLTRGDRVLLLKGAPDKRLWANQYNGVGGHVERGEDILAAARRELLEETHLTAEDLRLCGTVTVDTGKEIGIAIFVFRGECPHGEPGPSSEGELVWVPITEVSSLPLVEDLFDLLPRVLDMLPGDPPFAALYRYDNQGRLRITFNPDG